MSVCLFLSFRARVNPALDENALATLRTAIRATPKLAKALVHTAASATDPYLDDGAPPQLVLQLYFAALADLEAALRRDGHLQVLTRPGEFPGLAQDRKG